MTIWRRFGSVGFESLIHCRMNWYYADAGVTSLRGFMSLKAPFSQSNPICRYTSFRSFMTSGQAQTKPKPGGKGGDWRNPKVEDDVGIRINEAIKEHEVRIVTDQGHRVVSIQEALFLARRQNLDLVEVQRKVMVEGGLGFKPAVCKLMDYCKEKYKQDVKGKERVKSHATNTLRNGENKEVRFKGKTELKDLKIKAETVKRLMERGYRVKCTAMHAGKDEEDLGILLLNLLELIEDISIVESGPHIDSKNAFVIVKHVKFTSKKGKASKAMETVKSVLSARPTATSDVSSANKDDEDPGNSIKDENSPNEVWETVESDSENEIEDPSKQSNPNNKQLGDTETESSSKSKNRSSKSGGTMNIPFPRPPEQPEQSNRYNKGSNATFSSKQDGVFPEKFAPRNRGRVNERNGSNGNHGPGQLNPMNIPPRIYNPDSSSSQPARTYNPDSSSSQPPARTYDPVSSPSQPTHTYNPGSSFPRRNPDSSSPSQPAHTYNPGSSFPRRNPDSSSLSQPAHTYNPGSSFPRRNPDSSSPQPARTYNPDSSSSPRYGDSKASPSSDTTAPQRTYGIFSSTKSTQPLDDRANKSSSPAPGYEIFSTPKTISSDDQMKVREKSSHGSPPTPRFGKFTSSKNTKSG